MSRIIASDSSVNRQEPTLRHHAQCPLYVLHET